MDDLQRLTAALEGTYAIEREIGRGGMAVVYLAQDLKHDRPVAIKVLHPELAAGLGSKRFIREIEISANSANERKPLCKSPNEPVSVNLSVSGVGPKLCGRTISRAVRLRVAAVSNG